MPEEEDEEQEREISFDENEDFPEYANEKNKELNEKIKETKTHIDIVNKTILENNERFELLQTHYKNIQEVSMVRDRDDKNNMGNWSDFIKRVRF